MKANGTTAERGTTSVRFPALPIALLVLVIVLVWAAIGVHLWQERQQGKLDAKQSSGNLARGYAENIDRTIDSVDQVLKMLRTFYVQDPAKFDLAKIAPAKQILDGLTLQIETVDTAGIATMSNLPMSGHADLSERDYIRVHLNTDQDVLFISKPVLGRVWQQWSIQFSRKLFAPDGTFAGVIVVSLDPYYLSRIYESLAISRGSIVLAGLDDGVIRARAPAADNAIGADVSDAVMQLIRAGPTDGSSEFISRIDGTDRIYSYHRLDTRRLAVIVGLASDEVLANYHQDVISFVTAGGLATLLIVATGSVLIRQRRRLLVEQERLTATLDHISQGIIMIDRHDPVPVINRRLLQLLDLPQDLLRTDLNFSEIINRLIARGEFDPGQASGINPRALAEYRGPSPLVYERIRPNGTALEVRTERLPNGGAVRTFTDVTEHKRTVEALTAARNAAEVASKGRANFLAMMSHEIRTPMNGVISMAGLLLDTSLSPEQRRFAETLRDAAENLVPIIDDILDLSLLDANQLEFQYVPFSIEQVVADAVEFMHTKAAEKALEIRSQLAADVPPQLYGDPTRLRQILLNLISNGLKFTDAGRVMIEVSLLSSVDRKARISFAVRDTGIGIDTVAQAMLFQQFSQVDSAISRRFGGAGLGLAICRRLVEHMGGSLGVTSAIGQGSTFRFDVLLDVERQSRDRTDTASSEDTSHHLVHDDPAASVGSMIVANQGRHGQPR